MSGRIFLPNSGWLRSDRIDGCEVDGNGNVYAICNGVRYYVDYTPRQLSESVNNWENADGMLNYPKWSYTKSEKKP